MAERTLELGREQVGEARTTGRVLSERALRMHCAAYLASVKTRLLTGVILDLKATKGSLASGYSAKADALQRAEDRLHLEATERHRLQAQLIQAERMRAATALAGGVAHDLKNYLLVIGAGLDKATEVTTDGDTRAALADAAEATRAATALAMRLLDLERPRPVQRQRAELNEVVQSCVRLLRPTVPSNVDVRAALDPSNPQADLDVDQWRQALLNLGLNAKDALAERNGAISYATGQSQLRALPPSAPADARPGAFAWVRVTDNGAGMAPETVARAFEPFFTTKEHGKGTGLGLTQVYGCALAHGGFVEVSSKLGQGTSFQMFVPLSPSPATANAPAAASPAAAAQTRAATLLVVDDLDLGRRASVRMLERLGHHVEGLAGADEALARARALGAELVAVITDLRMPGHDGFWLLQALRQHGVVAPVVACSGSYSRAELHFDGFDAVLPKPFTPETARELLARLAAERRAPPAA
ncbi:MAG: response regulator [Deltaproteobacteria bacterium]|nr:response regulator [Deltaproteobacteria bacterium]